MRGSGILEQAIKINKTNKEKATHFVLCNGDKIRYLISLNGGKKRLTKNIATYSNKLGLMMKVLNYVPFSILMIGNFGYFAEINVHSEILEHLEKTKADEWNMIVGTYDIKQKLVLQCFKNNERFAGFIKIGNHETENEMLSEIDFLKAGHRYKVFDVPIILDSRLKDDECPFNILVTKEFVGERVEPVLTQDIINIYKEIAGETVTIDGVEYEFSHGDFAPWNIKKSEDKYTVFDWEHCGMRIKGFDLMHFVTIIQIALANKSMEDAFESALINIRKLEPCFSINKPLFLEEFHKIRVQIL